MIITITAPTESGAFVASKISSITLNEEASIKVEYNVGAESCCWEFNFDDEKKAMAEYTAAINKLAAALRSTL